MAGQLDHPRLREVVAKAEAKILAHPEVALGGIAFSADEARAMIGRGYRFIVLGSDAGLITGAAQRMVHAIRAIDQDGGADMALKPPLAGGAPAEPRRRSGTRPGRA